MSKAAICELNSEELDHVSGGEVIVHVDKGYAGIEIKLGGFGIAVWVMDGSVCGQVTTPFGIHGGCTP